MTDEVEGSGGWGAWLSGGVPDSWAVSATAEVAYNAILAQLDRLGDQVADMVADEGQDHADADAGG